MLNRVFNVRRGDGVAGNVAFGCGGLSHDSATRAATKEVDRDLTGVDGLDEPALTGEDMLEADMAGASGRAESARGDEASSACSGAFVLRRGSGDAVIAGRASGCLRRDEMWARVEPAICLRACCVQKRRNQP